MVWYGCMDVRSMADRRGQAGTGLKVPSWEEDDIIEPGDPGRVSNFMYSNSTVQSSAVQHSTRKSNN